MRFHSPSLIAGMIALAAGISPAAADVKLPAIFSNHMVLQRDVPVPVWGTADALEKVTVRIAGQAKTTTAGQDGKWMVKLDALKSGPPTILTIQGANTLTIRDVLVGEVWLCSGQSNMALPVSKAQNFEVEKRAAKWPEIREFDGKWVLCSPDTVGAFSATAYFFGREIHLKTGQAVGLIHRSAGGSPIELWTSWDAQKNVAELQPLFDPSEKAKTESKEAAAQAESDRRQAVEIEGKKAIQVAKTRPGYLFDNRIAPLIPYAIRGVIWYQGEANSYTIHADLYGRQLATMIADWRTRWGCDMPFISIQLPELGKAQTMPVEASGRALVREGVLQSLSLPNTGMAVTLGTGEVASNHPRNKQEAGRRLAQWALAMVYRQKGVAASGPLPAGHKIVGDKVIITFTHADGGLVARDGELKGFAIAGADMKWVWAHATIEGDTVIVSQPDVKHPVAVRYAWAANPASSNLANGAGLPASPFRTDGQPLPKKD